MEQPIKYISTSLKFNKTKISENKTIFYFNKDNNITGSSNNLWNISNSIIGEVIVSSSSGITSNRMLSWEIGSAPSPSDNIQTVWCGPLTTEQINDGIVSRYGQLTDLGNNYIALTISTNQIYDICSR